MPKVVELETALSMVKDGDVVISDGITFGAAEELVSGLEAKFLQTGRPRDLTVVAPGGSGDVRGRGFDHFAHEGFVKVFTGSYFNLTRRIGQLILDEKIEGYMLPLGVYCQLLREIVAGRPGLITHVGLETYVDPRYEGGRLNSISQRDEFVPELITIHGKEYLFYKPFHLDIALLRGTTADEDGNITMEKEAGILNALAIAMATKKTGGKVIVQVERVAAKHTLHPKDVRIPGIVVDAVVIARPENHMQTWREAYNPSLSGEIRIPESKAVPIPFDYKKAVGRRAVLELRPGMVVNIGAGMSEFVTSIAWEEGIQDKLTFIIEAGMIGGIPGFGLNFNTATNPACIIEQPSMIDFFDGGGCDISVLGFGQVDASGNINVSKLEGKIPGIGGFLNVAPNSKRRVHCGAFTAGKSDIRIENGRLRIIKDGEIIKFVEQVDQISVSGNYALKVGQPVKIITERAVFEWTKDGLVLKEIAPGVSVEEHILPKMAFRPLIAADLKEMPLEVFQDALLNLKQSSLWNGGD